MNLLYTWRTVSCIIVIQRSTNLYAHISRRLIILWNWIHFSLEIDNFLNTPLFPGNTVLYDFYCWWIWIARTWFYNNTGWTMRLKCLWVYMLLTWRKSTKDSRLIGNKFAQIVCERKAVQWHLTLEFISVSLLRVLIGKYRAKCAFTVLTQSSLLKLNKATFIRDKNEVYTEFTCNSKFPIVHQIIEEPFPFFGSLFFFIISQCLFLRVYLRVSLIVSQTASHCLSLSRLSLFKNAPKRWNVSRSLCGSQIKVNIICIIQFLDTHTAQ